MTFVGLVTYGTFPQNLGRCQIPIFVSDCKFLSAGAWISLRYSVRRSMSFKHFTPPVYKRGSSPPTKRYVCNQAQCLLVEKFACPNPSSDRKLL